LALLARELGYEVSGRDHNIYPPMSDQLATAGIDVQTDMNAALPEDAEIIVGNVMRRDMPVINQLLERVGRFYSGPQWLGERVLSERFVLAVSGTHGKTTTASMTAHILEQAGLKPGFLIGGVPGNFAVSARAGMSPFFVIEADEYDTAFFDKRAKFIHYRPRGVVVNNIEFDHADIYPNLAAIEQQFEYFLRLVPNNGRVIAPLNNPAVDHALSRGCFAPVERVADRPLPADCAGLYLHERQVYLCDGQITHNIGAMPDQIIGAHRGVIAVLDPRSNSMRSGAHKARLAESLAQADVIFIYTHGVDFDIAASVKGLGKPIFFVSEIEALIERVAEQSQRNDVVISMSNAGFGQFPYRLFSRLNSEAVK